MEQEHCSSPAPIPDGFSRKGHKYVAVREGCRSTDFPRPSRMLDTNTNQPTSTSIQDSVWGIAHDLGILPRIAFRCDSAFHTEPKAIRTFLPVLAKSSPLAVNSGLLQFRTCCSNILLVRGRKFTTSRGCDVGVRFVQSVGRYSD